MSAAVDLLFALSFCIVYLGIIAALVWWVMR